MSTPGSDAGTDGRTDDDAATAAAGGGHGVVVVHDWYGLHPHVLEYAEELTMAGFAVEAVDLYAVSRTTDPARAEELADALDGTGAVAIIDAAITRLRDAGAVAVGAVGFSLGGNLVLRAAREGAVDAVVAYYAVRSPQDAAATRCPVQLHLAETDRFEDPEYVAEYVAALEAAGTPVDTFAYPGTVHSFANTDVPLADAAAADVARARTVGFLHARLARSAP
ncbi:dienelactone hydrolase family protein [Cellulomonas sp. ATA003]|uniref:dienelactone hydrolase family protein n=1 Tax=Cellulomonas sp. ATA003 TaxID=3073064 RepID=UPI002873425A|nr:dienelactone hydrolase family protein [Cellulomonas sp. ATA003]WNB84786.1 dienelactone hydrolase family protein [Cellulomonas sp. ATA003]